jgi:hypothetical protein
LNWELAQLDTVLQAAADFSGLMQGAESGFRARMGRVPMQKTQGTIVDASGQGYGGLTLESGVVLAGDQYQWSNVQAEKWTIVHELAHWWDIQSWHTLSGGMVYAGFWQLRFGCQIPHVSVGLEVKEWWPQRKQPLNFLEDWADSVATYVYWQYAELVQPPKYISERRWNYVAQRMNPQSPQRYPLAWTSLNWSEP